MILPCAKYAKQKDCQKLPTYKRKKEKRKIT
jgi:hypothetical protein